MTHDNRYHCIFPKWQRLPRDLYVLIWVIVQLHSLLQVVPTSLILSPGFPSLAQGFLFPCWACSKGLATLRHPPAWVQWVQEQNLLYRTAASQSMQYHYLSWTSTWKDRWGKNSFARCLAIGSEECSLGGRAVLKSIAKSTACKRKRVRHTVLPAEMDIKYWYFPSTTLSWWPSWSVLMQWLLGPGNRDIQCLLHQCDAKWIAHRQSSWPNDFDLPMTGITLEAQCILLSKAQDQELKSWLVKLWSSCCLQKAPFSGISLWPRLCRA